MAQVLRMTRLRNTSYRGLTNLLKHCFSIIEEEWRNYDLSRLSEDMRGGNTKLIALLFDRDMLEQLEQHCGYYSEDLRQEPTYMSLHTGGPLMPCKLPAELP